MVRISSWTSGCGVFIAACFGPGVCAVGSSERELPVRPRAVEALAAMHEVQNETLDANISTRSQLDARHGGR
jgi:hypothetical protein